MKQLLWAILTVFVLTLMACNNYTELDCKECTNVCITQPTTNPQPGDTWEYFYAVKAPTSPGYGYETYKLAAGQGVNVLDFYMWTEKGHMILGGIYLAQDLNPDVLLSCEIRDKDGNVLATTLDGWQDTDLNRIVTWLAPSYTPTPGHPLATIVPEPILLSVFCDVTLNNGEQSPHLYVTGMDWSDDQETGAQYTMPPFSSWPEAKNLVFVMP